MKKVVPPGSTGSMRAATLDVGRAPAMPLHRGARRGREVAQIAEQIAEFEPGCSREVTPPPASELSAHPGASAPAVRPEAVSTFPGTRRASY